MFQLLLFGFVIIGGMSLLGWLTFTCGNGQLSANLELQRVVNDVWPFLEGTWNRIGKAVGNEAPRWKHRFELVDSNETDQVTGG